MSDKPKVMSFKVISCMTISKSSIYYYVCDFRCLYMDKAAGKFVQSLSQDTATLGHEETQFEERILKERLNLGLKVANSACEQVREVCLHLGGNKRLQGLYHICTK